MFLSINKCCLWSSRSGRYGSRALWDPKDHSPPHSVSRSLSGSPSPSPPHSRHRVGPHPHRPHGRPYSPHHRPRYQHYAGRPHKRVGTCIKWGNVELTRWMPLMLMTSVNCCLMSVTNVYIRHTDLSTHLLALPFFKWLDLIGCPKIDQTELFSLWIFLHTISWCSCLVSVIHAITIGGSSRSSMKRPHDESSKFSSDTSRHPSFYKAGHSSKHGPLQSPHKTVKTMMKPGTKTNKTASAKAADTVGDFFFSL